MSYLFPKPVQDAVLTPYGASFYVDTAGDDTTGLGSPTLPYATIQKGVDEAALAGGGTVYIAPGSYNETVFIQSDDDIYLLGYGSNDRETARIVTLTGPALVISNATSASLATWIAGGAANYDTNYGMLVAGTTTPSRVIIQNLSILAADSSPAEYGVVVAGVGAATTFLDNDLVISGCRMDGREGSLYARLANYIRIQGGSKAVDASLITNVAATYVDFATLSDVEVNYNTGLDEPFDTTNKGLNGAFGKFANVTLEGSARSGVDNLWGAQIDNFTANGTAAAAMNWGAIHGAVVTVGTASFNAVGTHVGGNISFQAGAPACSLLGGGYLGSKTDPSARFTYTTYKEITGGGGTAPTSTAMARVDPTSSDAVDDNDLTTAFLTIQGGYDAIINAGGGTVFVLPGTYVETVYIRKTPDVKIVGVDYGGALEPTGSVRIQGPAGKPSVVISEATQASLDTLFAGGVLNYDANYQTTLVSDSGAGIPSDVVLENLTLWPTDADEYSLVVAGVDADSDLFSSGGLSVTNCKILRGHYVRLANFVGFDKCHLINGSSGVNPYLYNVTECRYTYCQFHIDLKMRYDAAFRQPTEGKYGHKLEFCGKSRDISAPDGFDLDMFGEEVIDKAVACNFGEITLNNTAVATLINSSVDGAVVLAAGAKLDARGSTFSNSVNFNGGSLLCTFENCYVDTLVNAPAARLALAMMAGEFDLQTEKGSPTTTDLVVIEDSASGYAKRKVQIGNLPGATSSAMARVDSTSSDAVDDNDLTTAFVTIQGGVDAIANAGGGVVYIYPAVYDETVYIKDNNPVALVGLPGPVQEPGSRCVIRPAAALPCIVITEATKASVDSMMALGGYNTYNTNWGLLVADTPVPQEVSIVNLNLEPSQTFQVSVLVAGVSASSTLLADGLSMDSCYMGRPTFRGGIWARTANKIFMDDVKSDYIVQMRAISEFDIQESHIFSFSGEYDGGGSYELPSGGNQGYRGTYVQCGGNWATDSAATSTLHNVWIGGSAQVLGSGTGGILDIYDSYVGSACDVQTNGTFTAKNVFLAGFLQLSLFANPSTWEGGGWMGVLNDPGNKLTYSRVSDAWFPTKTTPVGADWFLVHDSADTDKLKRIDISTVPRNPTVQVLASDETVTGTTSPRSLASFSYDPTTFQSGTTFQFEVMLWANLGTLTAGVSLYNLTDGETVTGTSFTTSNTTPTRFNSGNLTVGAAAGNLKNSRKTYEIRLTTTGTNPTDVTWLGSASMITL